MIRTLALAAAIAGAALPAAASDCGPMTYSQVARMLESAADRAETIAAIPDQAERQTFTTANNAVLRRLAHCARQIDAAATRKPQERPLP